MTSSRYQSAAKASGKSLENSGELFPPKQPKQLSLYTAIPADPGSFDDENVVRGLITEAIRRSPKSREQICEEMSGLIGERVTVRMLNSYTSEAAEQHRWPAQYTRAFCHVVDDWRLLQRIAELSGFHVISDKDLSLLELGKQFLIRKRADERIALLEAQLRGRDDL